MIVHFLNLEIFQILYPAFKSCQEFFITLFLLFISDEDPDVLNEQFDHSFFEGVMSEIKRINVFFKGFHSLSDDFGLMVLSKELNSPHAT